MKKTKDKPETVPTTVLGRPTDFDVALIPVAAQLCDAGATDVDLADLFGVSVRTINRWKVAHPEFGVAVRKGKEAADERVVDALYHRAMGTEYEKAHPFKVKKITYGPDGKKLTEEEEVKVVMVKEVVPPDTTAMIFWLKNRRSQEWRDVHKHEHGGAGAFDQMDDAALAEYLELRAVEVREIEQQLLPAPVKGKAKAATKH